MDRVFVCAWNYFATMDITNGDVEIINDKDAGIYLGFAAATYNHEYVYVAQQNHKHGTKLLTYDFDLRLLNTYCIDGKAQCVKDMIWFQDQLWILCSHRDQNYVYRIDPYTKRHEIWYPDDIRSDVDDPHLNSMSITHDSVFIMAHNRSQAHSSIWVYGHDLKFKDKLVCGGNNCHNVCQLGNDVYYNLSGNGGLCRIGHEGSVLHLSGFSRGLAVNGDYVAVGVSAVGTRTDRGMGDSIVAVADRDFNLIEKYPLIKSGNINSVRFVRDTDYGHIVL